MMTAAAMALAALALSFPNTPVDDLHPQRNFVITHKVCEPQPDAYACVSYNSQLSYPWNVRMYIPKDATVDTYVHELAHVVDYRFLTPARRARLIPLLYRPGVYTKRLKRRVLYMENRQDLMFSNLDPWAAPAPAPAERFADMLARCAGYAASYRWTTPMIDNIPIGVDVRLPKPTVLRCALIGAQLRGAVAHD